jgi:hypothetical protein
MPVDTTGVIRGERGRSDHCADCLAPQGVWMATDSAIPPTKKNTTGFWPVVFPFPHRDRGSGVTATVRFRAPGSGARSVTRYARYAAFFLSSKNCSSSVEPFSAVVED